MKKTLLFLFLSGILFAGSFIAAQRIGEKQEKPVKKSRFEPAPFALKNHPFVLVVIGANNGAYLGKTLASVFAQNYENYRVVYIDDASNDGSFDLARDLVYDSGRLLQVTLVQNEERLGDLANLCRAVQTCQDDEIVVVLQGEDWLAHEWVLQRLNAYYADPALWLTYGQYREFPTYQLGICQKVETHSPRTQPFTASHLKTFYAGLFKKIREADFIYAGKYLPACSDLAYMIPMLEMAAEHSHFIPEILYIRNSQAVSREDRQLQARCETLIRSLSSYSSVMMLERDPCGN